MDVEVTVVIPTKHRLEFLMRSIGSVVRQGMNGIELFIADNNTDISTSEAVKNFISQFQSTAPDILFTYYKSDKKNAAGVRNDAIIAAKGKYLFFLDDDDEFLPRSIEKRLAIARNNPSVALLYCAAFSKIYPYPFRIYRYYEYQPWRHTNRLDIMSCSCMMINRDIMVEADIYFDEDLPRRHDYDFCRRIVEAKLEVVSVPDPLVQVNHHEYDRLSSKPFAQQNVHKSLKDKWGPTIDASIYDYAGGILVWRKCFGVEPRNYWELCKEFKNDFGLEASKSVKVKLALVCVHPIVFLTFYHVALIISQFYKNRIATILNPGVKTFTK